MIAAFRAWLRRRRAARLLSAQATERAQRTVLAQALKAEHEAEQRARGRAYGDEIRKALDEYDAAEDAAYRANPKGDARSTIFTRKLRRVR